MKVRNSHIQLKTLELFKTRDKKLLIYLMIIQKLDLKPLTNQNKIKQKEQDLKY